MEATPRRAMQGLAECGSDRNLDGRERLKLALMATDDHLLVENGRVVVCVPHPTEDDKMLVVGSFDPMICAEKNGVHPRVAISRIRFGWAR